MTITTKRIALIVGSGLLALGVAAGVRASAQNTNQDPAPFNHPRMGHPGPGGPMGFGGPMGPEGALRMLQMMADRIGLTDAQKEQLKSIAAPPRVLCAVGCGAGSPPRVLCAVGCGAGSPPRVLCAVGCGAGSPPRVLCA